MEDFGQVVGKKVGVCHGGACWGDVNLRYPGTCQFMTISTFMLHLREGWEYSWKREQGRWYI